MTPLRWGLLSTARINDKLLAAAPDRFVAVGSRDESRARAYAAEHRLERSYGSYEELLGDADVDVIYNPLPNGMHAEWTLAALQAGKHVLCEKPMSSNPAAVDEVFDVAAARGLIVAEAFMWRHAPQVALAQKLIADGAIGELRTLRAAFGFVLNRPDDVRFSSALDGGSLMDVGCYCVSGLRTLAGAEPERVQAEQVLGGDGAVDVRLVATLRFPGDVLALMDCGFDLYGRDELEAIGTHGTLFLDDPWHGQEPIVEVRSVDGIARHVVEAPSSYLLEIEDFEAAVSGERAPLLGRADAVAQARTLAALRRAGESTREAVTP
jgi:xylose dehydrogenase (NAD/NADP)